MPEINAAKPGNFCWPELATTDPAGAKRFYASLFGWAAEDMPAGPDTVYTMLRLRGLEIGALYSMGKGELAHGVPPHWNLYVAVASVDEAARKAKDLGGVLVAPPFDVMDAGRMAIVTDPTGAAFCLWQGKNSIGARLMNEDGAFSWGELYTRDVPKAKAFYTGLFGWTAKTSTDAGMEYTEWTNGGQPIGGMLAMMPGLEKVPPHWLVYFMVPDVDATAAKSKAGGGQLVLPPHDIPHVGRFSIITDAQGAAFAVIRLAPRT